MTQFVQVKVLRGLLSFIHLVIDPVLKILLFAECRLTGCRGIGILYGWA